ncbi:large ribosomal subunit protein bL28m [Rosa sericea]
MALRAKEMMRSVMKKVGDKNLNPRLKQELKKNRLPDPKIVMGRAQRGIFAGRHIQFGNNVSEDGGNKTRRNWKPNVQEKRLFSYILDRQIRVKVTTHALRCIDKAGGIDEYFLKTPYHKMDTEMGLVWKAKIEKLYEEVGQTGGYAFLQPKDEPKVEQEFKELKLDEREVKRQMYGWSKKLKQIEERKDNQISNKEAHEEGAGIGEGSSHVEDHEQLVANS